MVDETVVREGKVFAVVGYIWILCFVPLILKRDNKFAAFHAKQGLVLFLFSLVLGLINIIPLLGQLIWIVGGIMCSILGLIGIIKALSGEYWRMPIIGDLADKFKI